MALPGTLAEVPADTWCAAHRPSKTGESRSAVVAIVAAGTQASMRGEPTACDRRARPHIKGYGPAAVHVYLRERQRDGVRDRRILFTLCGRSMRTAETPSVALS